MDSTPSAISGSSVPGVLFSSSLPCNIALWTGTVPPQVQPQTGTWSVSDGKLHAELPAEQSPATALLTSPATNGPLLSLKVQSQDTAGLASGEECFAGVSLAGTTEGRHLVGLVSYRDSEGLLRRMLRVARVPVGTVVPEVVAETEGVEYGGEELTLNILVDELAQTFSVSLVEHPAETPLTAVQVAGGAAGSRQLEAWGRNAFFDDLNWVEATPSKSLDYEYNALNQLRWITGSETGEYQYDPAGRLETRIMNGQTTKYFYDRLDRLTDVNGAVPTAKYTYYGPSWMRESATVSGVETTYLYDGFACVAQATGGVTTNYMVPDRKPVWETTNGTTLVHAQDGMGNVTGLWGPSGYVNKFRYDAFGKVTTLGPDGSGGWTPVQNTSGPRYRGEMYDASTDQVYLRNRFYSPDIGRFISADPLGMVDGPNMYNYCLSDPVNNSDPMGTEVLVNGDKLKMLPLDLDAFSLEVLRQMMAILPEQHIWRFDSLDHLRQMMNNPAVRDQYLATVNSIRARIGKRAITPELWMARQLEADSHAQVAHEQYLKERDGRKAWVNFAKQNVCSKLVKYREERVVQAQAVVDETVDMGATIIDADKAVVETGLYYAGARPDTWALWPDNLSVAGRNSESETMAGVPVGEQMRRRFNEAEGRVKFVVIYAATQGLGSFIASEMSMAARVPSQLHGGKYGVRVGPAYARGSGTLPGGHNANFRLTRHRHRRTWREVSGEQTFAQRALGGRRGSLSSHTETKGLTRVFLQEGDDLLITGTRRPCPPCRGALNQAAKESGARVIYRWREAGMTWEWEAGTGLVRKGAQRANPGNTVRW